jgi:type I restriction enzyme S subunit
MSGLIGGVSTSALRNFDVPIPSEAEQLEICKFLDRETFKIDELILRQKFLIDSLEEKKHISVLEIMSNGVGDSISYNHNPSIFWLQKIPKHWEQLRAKFIFEIKKRIAGELGYKVLSITQRGIKVRDLESNDGQLSMDYSKYQIVEPGDFAMNHMDLLTGYVDISPETGVTSPDYRVFSIRNMNRFVPEFYLLILQLCYKSKLFYPFGQGAAQFGRWRLPTDAFNNFIFPVPPVSEQELICDAINRQNKKIDALIGKASLSIELLKEHRASLISAAVTGKIDVRN